MKNPYFELFSEMNRQRIFVPPTSTHLSDFVIYILESPPANTTGFFRVGEIAYGFGGSSKQMSVLINFLLQNTNLVSVLSKICPNFAGHVGQD